MKQLLANIFGALGYISLLTQWVWTVIILGAPIVASDIFRNIFLPEKTTHPAEVISMDVPEPIAILFMVLALIFSIGISLYVVIAMPRSIAQTGRKITHKSAQIIAPRITHKKHISKKREKKLIEQITWSVKTILVIIPIMALVIPPADMIGLSHKIVISVGLFCAATTTIWFSLEFAIAKLARLDSLRVW